jgi:hypothetical protein
MDLFRPHAPAQIRRELTIEDGDVHARRDLRPTSFVPSAPFCGYSFSCLDRHPGRLSAGRRRIAPELSKGLAVEFHHESVGGLMGRLIDVPAWTDEEKFDGQTLGLFIERSLASGNRIIGRPVHDMAAG